MSDCNHNYVAEDGCCLECGKDILQDRIAKLREALISIRATPAKYDYPIQAMHEMAQIADDALEAGDGQ